MTSILSILTELVQKAALLFLGIFNQNLHKPLGDTKPEAMKKIVILGGSYAGISTAHRLLKQVNKASPFKITLVSPSSDMYWNMASPRGIIPGKFTDDQLFQPIATGFAQYPATQFEFELASATGLDLESQKVTITDAAGERTLDYDYLIIATGSRTKTATPFKSLSSTEETKKLLHSYQAAVQKAHTIVVAGGGVTGVEIAGELGSQYGTQKEIILVNSNSSHSTFNAGLY
jgi:NADH dehydrogenase FAD-containing subunit